MSFEKMRIRKVNNHYGPRDSGGTQGVNGEYDSYSINFDGGRIDGFIFPMSNNTTMPGVPVLVTGVITANATGTLGTMTIGGVDVKAATAAAPVKLAADNNGKVVITGITAGTVLIKYMKFKG